MSLASVKNMKFFFTAATPRNLQFDLRQIQRDAFSD